MKDCVPLNVSWMHARDVQTLFRLLGVSAHFPRRLSTAIMLHLNSNVSLYWFVDGGIVRFHSNQQVAGRHLWYIEVFVRHRSKKVVSWRKCRACDVGRRRDLSRLLLVETAISVSVVETVAVAAA